MGERLGGRQKGTKNKATIERENLISRAIGELNRPLGKDVLGLAARLGDVVAVTLQPGHGCELTAA
jgi:hypothetical protein